MDEEILNLHSSTNNTVCVTVKKRQKTFESLPDKKLPTSTSQLSYTVLANLTAK